MLREVLLLTIVYLFSLAQYLLSLVKEERLAHQMCKTLVKLALELRPNSQVLVVLTQEFKTFLEEFIGLLMIERPGIDLAHKVVVLGPVVEILLLALGPQGRFVLGQPLLDLLEG